MNIFEKGQLKYQGENIGLDANLIALNGTQWLDAFLTEMPVEVTNANGTVWKFPSGLMIAMGNIVLDSNTTAGKIFDLPVTFSSNESYFLDVSIYSTASGGEGASYVVEKTKISGGKQFRAKVLVHAATTITAAEAVNGMYFAFGR